MSGILAGIRVLELGQVLAGPFAGAILADLGAEAIKLERVDGGDDAHHMGPAFRDGDALNFHIFNRGKKSVALDLKSVAGRDAFERLAADSDIFIHNMRPGVTAALGIDGPALCARHPRLVYCAISAFGDAGPMHMRPGYEPLIQAFSGLSSTNGGPDDPAHAQRCLGMRPGHRHVGGDRRAGSPAAAAVKRTRRRGQCIAPGNRAGVERPEGGCLQQPGAAAGTPSLGPRRLRAL